MSLNKVKIREEWELRQNEYGNVSRAVLMKGLHPSINATIDRWHRDVMSYVLPFKTGPSSVVVLDMGCGFGRLADEAKRSGFTPVGMDFTHAFCAGFADKHGPAVCGDLVNLPFRNCSFTAAYSVTSLMYLDAVEARLALVDLDRCLCAGATVLVLEPCREFNDIVRRLLPRKRRERLAVPGFTLQEFRSSLIPEGWRIVAAGDSRWLTVLLPLLMLTKNWTKCFRGLAKIVLWLDRPSSNKQKPSGRISMYRWISCRKEK